MNTLMSAISLNTLNNNLNPAFSSKRTFKRMFKRCTYSGEEFEHHDTRTIEHIIPQSLGGKNEYSNYLIVKRSWNSKRSSVPLDEFIKANPQVKENIIKTVNSMEGKTIEGINWADEVKKTLYKAIGYDIFKLDE